MSESARADPGPRKSPLTPAAFAAGRGSMFHIKPLAPPPRAKLSEPGDDAQADPDRREHHVEDEVGEDDQRPPHGPVAKRDPALLVLHALWRSSMTRNTRCAV